MSPKVTGARLNLRRSAAFALGLLAVGLLAAYLGAMRNRAYTTSTRLYPTIQSATLSGAITNGWLPEFLPSSAYDIRERHNYEQNTIIAGFRFEPRDRLEKLLSAAEKMDPERTSEVPPPALRLREPWFPAAISQGKLRELLSRGFTLYRVKPRVANGIQGNWYLAINIAEGRAFLWNGRPTINRRRLEYVAPIQAFKS